MAWLVKSEVNGDPLTQEQYEKETLMLPHGKEKYASLYESLYYLQDIDLLVILVCCVRNIEIPDLFCISKEEAISIRKDHDEFDSYRMLTTYFDDEVRKDGHSRRYRFAKVKYPLTDIITALLYGYDSPIDYDSTMDFIEIHKSLLTLQKAYASEILAYIDENDKKSYLWFTASFRPCYNVIINDFVKPRDNIAMITKEDISFHGKIKGLIQDSNLDSNIFQCGKRIPEIILELEREQKLIRKDVGFVASKSGQKLVMGLDEGRKKFLRKAFDYWIRKNNGEQFSPNTIEMYFKS